MSNEQTRVRAGNAPFQNAKQKGVIVSTTQPTTDTSSHTNTGIKVGHAMRAPQTKNADKY